MGLSIHYSGSFKNDASLSKMIEEVKDIAEVYKWRFNIYETEFSKNAPSKTDYDKNIYGISFTPTNCETISLCFLSNGRMSSAMHLKLWADSTNKTEQEYLYMISVKTQYAGAQTHMLVIHLLKHLSKKYFQNFTVNDEGQYWETGDEKLLQETFERYTDLLNSVSTALEIFPVGDGESIENYLERVLKQVHSKKNQ